MSDPLMTGTSARNRARWAGAVYVACIACGFYAELVVRARLVVSGDAALTAQHIVAQPELYRAGFFADVSAMVLGVLSSILLYGLFRVVSRGLALIVLVLDIISNAVSIAGSVLLFAPLVILRGDAYLAAFTVPQLDALALLSIRLYEFIYAISLGLFSGSCLVTGILIQRSGFLPRALGWLMMLAGACYFANTLIALMPKGFGDFLVPWIFAPILVGEGAMALWLLLKAVDPARWDAVAGESGRSRRTP